MFSGAALHVAARLGNIAVVQALTQRKSTDVTCCEPDTECTAAHVAASCNRFVMRVRIFVRVLQPLAHTHTGCVCRHDILSLLLAASPAIAAAEDAQKETVLFAAVRANDPSCVRCALSFHWQVHRHLCVCVCLRCVSELFLQIIQTQLSLLCP